MAGKIVAYKDNGITIWFDKLSYKDVNSKPVEISLTQDDTEKLVLTLQEALNWIQNLNNTSVWQW